MSHAAQATRTPRLGPLKKKEINKNNNLYIFYKVISKLIRGLSYRQQPGSLRRARSQP